VTLSPALHDALQQATQKALGASFRITDVTPIAGGDINTALRLNGPAGSVFAKLRGAEDTAMFAAETEGLKALARCDAIRVPAVLGQSEAGGQAFLLLEWLDFSPLRVPQHARRAGEALAALHRNTGEHFGWPHDNFIGSTPQPNIESDNWPHFFVRQRLQPQFELAASKGYKGELQSHGERLCGKAPALFLEYRPQASLLHGDLWSGNLGALADGTPVLFDPACYFGDRDADLALSELFGGLPLDFYSAYRTSWPLAEGYEQRKALYNLYHILNHLNLFGGGYLRQAERMAAQLASELGR
jgi:fructosamine-3-kinase